MRRSALGLILVLGLASCGKNTAAPSVEPVAKDRPWVVQTGQVPVNWTEFTPHFACGPNQSLHGIVAGPDGNMWVADPCGGLMRISMTGLSKEFLFSGFVPTQLAVGSDKRIYMTQTGTDVIGVSDLSGNLQTYDMPSRDTVFDGGIGLGPDGRVWFDELSHFGAITTTGAISEYPNQLPYYDPNQYGGVTAGPNGDVWFSLSPEFQGIDEVDPSSGAIVKSFLIFPCSSGGPIIFGADASAWFFCHGLDSPYPPLLNEINVSHQTNFAIQWDIAGGLDAYPEAMTRGPDGNPWWASVNGALAEYDVASHAIVVYIPPDQSIQPQALAEGPDGNVWAVTSDGHIVVYIINVLRVQPRTLSFASVGQEQTIKISELGKSSWNVTTSNSTIAAVAPGESASQFVVTAEGAGNCSVTVHDKTGNTFTVPVSVQ